MDIRVVEWSRFRTISNATAIYVVSRGLSGETQIRMKTFRSICRDTENTRVVRFNHKLYALFPCSDLSNRLKSDLENIGHFSIIDSKKIRRIERKLPELDASYFIDINLPAPGYM